MPDCAHMDNRTCKSRHVIGAYQNMKTTVFPHIGFPEMTALTKQIFQPLKISIMEERKKVEINEKEILRMMAADIPPSLMTGTGEPTSRLAGEDRSENKSPAPDESAQPKKSPPEAGRDRTPRKKSNVQGYPKHLFDDKVVRGRRQTYVSEGNYDRVRTLLSVIAPAVSISCYIDNILSDHLDRYRDELNAIYSSRLNLKPL